MKNSAALRVLVVDDEALIRWSVSQTLVERGYEVVETADASDTRLAVGDTQPFDVVLLDYRLPDSDDLSLLASIRKASPTTQVILMTAFSSPEVVRGALDLGAYRVINKPFDMHAIADLVAQAHTAGSNGETSVSFETPWSGGANRARRPAARARTEFDPVGPEGE